ncbi:tubulin-tyrosine ligase family protein [Stylonychia lemnae]|uniref:Tubulin-tyrosine ligase family protein n=1 Tax=Stylonychia lemnae TaxID=5949 RepID=A0A078B2S1_STYLE|nr:tubulin-tyrosine ligase family protein [Stylonychia lemnae]|eukprot:CDW87803.1 tubulin-tyrosine ligase family protein [Stylonychia lemnae]
MEESDMDLQTMMFKRQQKKDIFESTPSKLGGTNPKLINKLDVGDCQVTTITGQNSEIKAKKSQGRDPKEQPLLINVSYTQYEVLKDVAEDLNFNLSYEEEEDWDIYWIDGPVAPAFLLKMQAYQRASHFPGMFALARKNLLAKNLQAMKKVFSQEFNFFPKTWLIPQDAKDFKAQFNNKKAKTFIIKPEASCQGKGIFLTRNFDWLQAGEHYVAQRYLHKPYLIDNLKFDLRIYVLLTGINPLRAFIYREGLARFATEEYNSPLGSNLNNLCMHLTNYAINKDSDQFVFNEDPSKDDVGHKRGLKPIWTHIDNNRKPEGKTAAQVWQDIKEVIVKTLITGQPHIAHLYRSSKPDDVENSMCFQILGFDIFIDNKCKPWLIEVNQSPSFTTDTPLDFNIKKALICDTVEMLNLSWKRKNKYIAAKRAEQQKRVLVGKQKVSQEEREALREKKLRLKDKYETNHLGNYEMLYPLKKGADEYSDQLMEKYDLLLVKSKEIWEESISGGGYVAKKKESLPETKSISSSGTNKPGSSQGLRKTSNNFQRQQQVKSNQTQKQTITTYQNSSSQFQHIQPQTTKDSTPVSHTQPSQNSHTTILHSQSFTSQNNQSQNQSIGVTSSTSSRHQVQQESFFVGYPYIREEAEADYIRLSQKLHLGQHHAHSPVKLKSQPIAQNSLTQLDFKYGQGVPIPIPQMNQIRNSSVDQAIQNNNNSKGFQKKPSQALVQGQQQQLQTQQQQMIPINQQLLTSKINTNQLALLYQKQGQPIMTSNQSSSLNGRVQTQQNDQMLRINSIDRHMGIPGTINTQVIVNQQTQNQQSIYVLNGGPNNRQTQQAPRSNSNAVGIVGVSLGPVSANAAKNQSLKNINGMVYNNDSLMLKGMSLGKGGQIQQVLPQQIYRMPYQRQ